MFFNEEKQCNKEELCTVYFQTKCIWKNNDLPKDAIVPTSQ